VINEARESGVKLILTLTDSRGDYGGMPEYVRAVLGDRGSITDFYTSGTVRVRVIATARVHMRMSRAADHSFEVSRSPTHQPGSDTRLWRYVHQSGRRDDRHVFLPACRPMYIEAAPATLQNRQSVCTAAAFQCLHT